MKLIGLFGSDINQSNLPTLQEAINNKYTIFALDAKAILFSLNNNLPYVTLDDFLDDLTIRKASSLAFDIERSWFNDAYDDFCHNGLCWPMFDHQAMHYFWRDAIVASVLLKIFRDSGGGKIDFLKPYEHRNPVHNLKAEVWKGIFDFYFNNERNLLGYDINKWLDILFENVMTCKPHKAKRSQNAIYATDYNDYLNKDKPIDFQSNKIIIAINDHEAYRFMDIIDKLHANFNNCLTVIFIFRNQKIAEELKKKFQGIRVLLGPHFINTDSEVGYRFLKAYKNIIQSVTEELYYLPLNILSWFFEFYCFDRWPKLSSSLTSWDILLKEEKPSVLIVSQLNDAESQIPAESANRLGIETFALPHGAFYIGDEVQVSNNNLFSDEIHKAILLYAGVPKERITACKDMVLLQEYSSKVYKNIFPTTPNIKKILIILGPSTIDGMFTPFINLKKHMAAIRSIANIRKDINDKVSIKYKVHPNWSDFEMLCIAEVDQEDILPSDADLHSLLKEVDLVIDINFSSGSAIKHIIRANKPIIFYWNSMINMSHWAEDIFLKAGTKVTNTEELSNHIYAILYDNMYYEYLIKKVKNFSNKNLSDKDFPSLTELIFKSKNFNKQTYELIMNKITNLDADADFYYGEIPKDHLESIIATNKNVHNIEYVVEQYCDATKNQYFKAYCLDSRRALSLELFGSLRDLKILDYGCGLGTIGLSALKRGAKVIFADSCLLRLEFAFNRVYENNIATHATFYGCKKIDSLLKIIELNSIDIIILNGVLEWVATTDKCSFNEVLNTQLGFLNTAKKLLKKTGFIFLAIENRFALRYFSGYPEDHTEIPFLSIMSRRQANELHLAKKGEEFLAWTWGYDEYFNLLPKVGLKIDEAYAIFPDYRFPELIVSMDDQNGIRNAMLYYEEKFINHDDLNRFIGYFSEMGILNKFVYSFGLVIRKNE